MVLEGEFPPDERVEKEALSLINSGFEVHLACYSRNDVFLREENYRGIYIHRKSISKFIYKSSAACLILPFYFIFWRKFLNTLLKKHKYNVIHIHDLPLAKIGFKLKKKYNTKLICDQHEYYSNWIIHTAHYNTFLGSIVKYFSPWRTYEKKYLTKADRVITVEEPLMNIYIEQHGISRDKIFYLPNTPLKAVFNQNNIKKEIIEKYNNSFVVIYVGGIDILRGVDLAIKALKQLSKKIPLIKLLLIGPVIKPFNPLEFAEAHNVRKYVEYLGWLSVDLIPSYLASSNICFFTPPVNRDEIHNTIATKIYQYIAMGKPVIVGQAKLMKQFVQQNDLGLVVNETNPSDFAQAIIRFYNDPMLQKRLSNNCIRVAKRYYWEKTSTYLINSYLNIICD